MSVDEKKMLILRHFGGEMMERINRGKAEALLRGGLARHTSGAKR